MAPGSTSVMKPESGTYGEVAELDKLSQDIQPPGVPGSGGGAPPQPSAPAPGMPTGPRPQPAAGTVPDILLAPTKQPDVPASTPLVGQAQMPSAVTGNQRRLAVLDALSRSEEVSDETREWAALVLQQLASRQA